ncbi:MAG: hypothetical protein FVQ77_05635 [Cytophagales bacterium]|nr:hypothetical protein [Cytophagales bacterium]
MKDTSELILMTILFLVISLEQIEITLRIIGAIIFIIVGIMSIIKFIHYFIDRKKEMKNKSIEHSER